MWYLAHLAREAKKRRERVERARVLKSVTAERRMRAKP